MNSGFAFDDLTIYRRSLSKSEIKQLSNREQGAVKKGLKTVKKNVSPLTFSVPLTPEKIKIDGTIDKQEWQTAAQLTGFLDYTQSYSENQTTIWVCYDLDNLYFAVRSRLPNGNRQNATAYMDQQILKAHSHKRDSAVYNDEAFEIFLSNRKDYADSRNNIIQFVGNSIGTIFDRRFNELGWNGDWKFKNKFNMKLGTWDAEVAISFKSLKLKVPSPGEKWYMNFARDWKQPMKSNTSLSGSYMKRLAVAIFTGQAVAIQNKGFGSPLSGNLDLTLKILNSDKKAANYKTSLELSASGRKECITKKSVVQNTCKFQKKLSHVGEYALSCTIKDRKTDSVQFTQTIPFNVSLPISLHPFYLFGKKKVGVLIDLSKLPLDPINDLKFLDVILTQGDKKLKQSVKSFSKLKFPLYFKPCNAKAGSKLQISAVTVTRNGEKFSQTSDFTIPEMPKWYGKFKFDKNYVPYPWTPVKYDSGTISVWNRKYIFSNRPIPDKIIVAGKNILTAPVSLKLTAGKKTLIWDSSPVKVVEHTPTAIVIQKNAKLGDLDICVITSIEFDGMMRIDLKLSPLDKKTITIDKLSLLIPVKKEYSYLYHKTGTWSEAYWGKTEKAVNDKDIFRNYYWMGNDDIGLCWFTDRKTGWSNDGKPMTGIRKQGNAYVGFMIPVGIAKKLSKVWKLTFGLEATPSRPHEFIKAYTTVVRMNSADFNLKLPSFPDTRTAVAVFPKGNSNYPPISGMEEYYKKMFASMHKNGLSPVQYQYIDSGTDMPVHKIMWGEWASTMPASYYQWSRAKTMNTCMRSSHLDYVMSTINLMSKEYDMDGFYFDGVIGRDCERADVHGSDCQKGIWPIFISRERIKRALQIIRRNKGKDSIAYLHCSSTNIAPLDGLGDVLLKGENYGTPIPYERLTYDVMRAQFGKQLGPHIVVLPQLTKKQMIPTGKFVGLMMLHGVDYHHGWLPPKDRRKLVYPSWRIMGKFGYPKQTQFFPYFKQKAFTDKQGKPISFYLNKKTGKYLLILANQSAKEVQFNIVYHSSAAPLKDKLTSAVERMSNDKVKFQNKTGFSRNLLPWGIQLIEISTKP